MCSSKAIMTGFPTHGPKYAVMKKCISCYLERYIENEEIIYFIYVKFFKGWK
jgi:hypothetical protein